MKAVYALTVFLFTAGAAVAQPAAGVSLKVSEETVPAGGVAQVKVFLTEPKPIVRTGMRASFEEGFFDEFLGIAAGGGLTGVARARNGQLQVELSSPVPGVLGPDYPLLTVAVRMRPHLPVGAVTPVVLDLGSSYWLNPAHNPLPEEAKAGSVTIGGSMFIGNVLPGGGTLMPGESFRVTGVGFVAGLQVRAEGARLESFTPGELIMTAKQRIQLDGTRIRVRLPNREEQSYYSYLRGNKTTPSAEPALRGLFPVFSAGAAREALVQLSQAAGDVNAIGLQNPTAEPVQIELAAVSIFGQRLSVAPVVLEPHQMTFRSFLELFGAPAPPNAVALRASSAGSFQITLAHVNSVSEAIQVPDVVTLRRGAY